MFDKEFLVFIQGILIIYGLGMLKVMVFVYVYLLRTSDPPAKSGFKLSALRLNSRVENVWGYLPKTCTTSTTVVPNSQVPNYPNWSMFRILVLELV